MCSRMFEKISRVKTVGLTRPTANYHRNAMRETKAHLAVRTED